MLVFAFALGHFTVLGDHNAIARHRGDLTVHLGFHDGAGILSDATFHAGRHKRRFGFQQRHCLALHV